MPLFESAEEALRWAYGIKSRPVFKLSGIYAMGDKTRKTGEGEGLSPFDLHAQAAQIILKVDSMPEPARSYLKAQYGMEFTNEVRAELLKFCRRALRGAVGGEHAVALLISNYVGQRVSIRALRLAINCSNDRAHEIRDKLFESLDKLRFEALAMISRHLEEAGLVIGGEYDFSPATERFFRLLNQALTK